MKTKNEIENEVLNRLYILVQYTLNGVDMHEEVEYGYVYQLPEGATSILVRIVKSGA